MRLTDLHPQFVGAGGKGIWNADGTPAPLRTGVGVLFDCPCGCDRQCYIPFANPMDGGPALQIGHPLWQREGETFDTLKLTPSILRSKDKGGCGWHGFIGSVEPGEVTTV